MRKDNTILYDSNRYSVPLGTYNKQKEVQIRVQDGMLQILTVFGDPICEHLLSTGRGMLIKNQNHSRNKDEKLDHLLETIDELFEHQAYDFLRRLRYDKSRYARDQLKLVEKLHALYGQERTLEAICACEKLELYSATYVKDWLAKSHPLPEVNPVTIPISDKKYHAIAAKRPLEEYIKAGGR